MEEPPDPRRGVGLSGAGDAAAGIDGINDGRWVSEPLYYPGVSRSEQSRRLQGEHRQSAHRVGDPLARPELDAAWRRRAYRLHDVQRAARRGGERIYRV